MRMTDANTDSQIKDEILRGGGGGGGVGGDKDFPFWDEWEGVGYKHNEFARELCIKRTSESPNQPATTKGSSQGKFAT